MSKGAYTPPNSTTQYFALWVVAAILDEPLETVLEEIEAKRLLARRIGGELRVDSRDLREYMDATGKQGILGKPRS